MKRLALAAVLAAVATVAAADPQIPLIIKEPPRTEWDQRVDYNHAYGMITARFIRCGQLAEESHGKQITVDECRRNADRHVAELKARQPEPLKTTLQREDRERAAAKQKADAEALQ